MDKLAELSHGAKVVLGAAVALLVVSFFNWFQYNDVGFATMWNGIGVLAGLCLTDPLLLVRVVVGIRAFAACRRWLHVGCRAA